MTVQPGSNVSITVNANNMIGLQDATMSRTRIELDTTTVGDDGRHRRAGIKDVALAFSGVVDPTAQAFIDLLNAARDGTSMAVIFTHDTDSAPNQEFSLTSCLVLSLELTSTVKGVVEFSASIAGNDTTNGWVSQ